MRALHALPLLALLLIAPPAVAQPADTTAAAASAETAIDTSAQVAAARSAAEAWLAHVDAGKYGKSWEEAAEPFKSQLTRDQWKKAVEQVEAQYGTPQSRPFDEGAYTTSLQNAPEGRYVRLIYDAQYANPGADQSVHSMRELVVMMREDDAWKAIGYRARPAKNDQQ